MAERRRIALSYTYNENWIGGTYYIENLVHALNSLTDKAKPHIILIVDNQKDLEAAREKITYPYLSFQLSSGEKNQPFRIANKITNRLFGKTLFDQRIPGLDAVFPYYSCIQQSLARKKIYWIPDFQEHFAPDFFSKEYREERKKNQMMLQASSDTLIVSSVNALNHFKLLYPGHKVRVNVLPFAVSHPDYRQLNIVDLLDKYHLPLRYFICPNQFWKHKNQALILKAVKELKKEGINITVAFTGNTVDYRNPGYFGELREYVKEHDLGNEIKFLGFIDRLDQLQLMNKSVAVIQPSFFEGWSTVVEDAKSMNKFLIVSNIDVHKEQLQNSTAMFFDPLKTRELADALSIVNNYEMPPPLFENNDYTGKIYDFGSNFLKICESA